MKWATAMMPLNYNGKQVPEFFSLSFAEFLAREEALRQQEAALYKWKNALARKDRRQKQKKKKGGDGDHYYYGN